MSRPTQSRLRYTLLKGKFQIFFEDLPLSGPEPDGDTIRFIPDDPFRVFAIKRFGMSCPDLGRRGINIRFEGIDALETHYDVTGAAGAEIRTHQQLELATAARDFLLNDLGFRNVVFHDEPNNQFKVKSVDNPIIDGYVIANGVDTYGRLIAFVYKQNPTGEEGDRKVFVDENLVEQSVNLRLIRAGLVYPALYTTLPIDLITHLRGVVKEIRPSRNGIWGNENVGTRAAAAIPDLDALQTLVMWPKLFRRLATFFATGNTSLDLFDEWLRDEPKERDDRMMLPTGELGNLHDMIAIQGNTLGLNVETEDVTILPDDV